MDELQRHYLAIMGIQLWEAREAPAVVTQASLPPQAHEAEVVVPAGTASPQDIVEVPSSTEARPAVSTLDWPELREQVAACTACDELVANRTQTVFGVGNPQAELLVIGEAPGADEDRQGEPFVGRAGQLLNAMLAAIGLQRGQVYIANVLKCRPPNNRDPKVEEADACAAFLQRQIALLQPKVILVVGRIAAQNLLHTDAPLGKLRGQRHRLENGVPVVVTYHPAYLLRSPQEKRKAWSDLCLASDILSQEEA
jgi:uracil-DNA glycosylase family 4